MPTELKSDTASQIAESIRRDGRAFFRVLGTSMSPGLPSGSIVNVIAVEIGAARVGMLVAFLRAGRIFVHRVVVVNSRHAQLVTRGDALPFDDPAIGSHEFLGIVTAVISPERRSFAERGVTRMRTAYRSLLRNLRP